MPVNYIQNASLDDLVSSLSRFKAEGSRDPKVRQLAEIAVAGEQDQISAVHNFVRDTFPYQPDPENSELFIHPRKVAQDYFTSRIRRFDCDDSAMLVGSMLSSLGYETRILLVELRGPGIDHALAQVKTSIGWLAVDAVSSKPLGWIEQYKQVIIVP
mgnify:CR=1 FL=1